VARPRWRAIRAQAPQGCSGSCDDLLRMAASEGAGAAPMEAIALPWRTLRTLGPLGPFIDPKGPKGPHGPHLVVASCWRNR
jgi:hypothetical protein